MAHLQRRFKVHLLPVFGERRLVDVNAADVRSFVAARLKAGAANAEINRELAALKRVFRLAKQSGRFVAEIPYVAMLKERNVRTGFFDRAQVDAVRKHLSTSRQPVVEFAFLTGWRVKSEILPLEWRHIDWTGRMIRLDPGTTKNDGRGFPMTAALDALLKTQLAEHDRLKQGGRIVPYVFHRNGKPIKVFRKAFERACRLAGVPGRLLHDFRRSAVKNLERDGVSRSAAKAMVGHQTDSIYQRYAIVDAVALRDAAEKIDRRRSCRMPRGQSRGQIPETPHLTHVGEGA